MRELVVVVDDAIRFVSLKSVENIKSSPSFNEDTKGSNEPDYDEDKDQPEGEQEEQTRETTISQIF